MAKTIKKLAALAVALMICVSAMSVGVFALDTPSLTMYDQRCIDADSEFEVNVEAWNFNDVFGAFIVLDLDGLELVSVSKNGTKELTANQDYYVSEGKVRIAALGDKNGDSVTAALEDGGSALTLKLKMPKESSLKDSYNISFVTDEQEEYYCEFVDFSNADINVNLTSGSVKSHQWSKWYEDPPATAANDGQKYRYCEICDKQEYQSIPSIITAESVEFSNIALIEDYDCSIETDEYDVSWKRYYYTPEFTVTLDGGQVLESQDGGIFYEDEWYYPTITDNQSSEKEWEKCVHTVSAKIFGKTATFDVEIVENPVEYVTVQDISIIEGTNLETREDWETDPPTEYEVYSYYPEFSVKLKGEDTVYNSWEGPITVLGREFYSIDYIDDQSKTNKWGIGPHTVNGKFLGVDVEFKVIITESPFESIVIDDVTLIEEYDAEESYAFNEETQDWDIPWQEYRYDPEFTVVLKNGKGTRHSENGWVYYQDQGYCLEFTDDQSVDNEWGKGEYTVTGKILGLSADFKVNIIENPVERVIVPDISITEGTNLGTAYEDDDEYECYYYDIDEYTVKFNNGMPDTTVYDGEALNLFGRNFWLNSRDDQSAINIWGVGEHTVTAEFLGVEATFTVTITPSPIKSVTAEDISVIEKTGGSYVQSWVGDSDTPVEWYEYGCDTKVTVELQDGTFKDATNGIQIGGKWYYPSYDSDQAYDNQWGVGTHTATVTLLGKSDEFNVTVTASPVESLVINSVDIIENVDGDIWGEDEEDYFRYWYDPTFTVKLNDGRTFTSSYNYGSQEVEIDGERYRLTFEDTQWEEHWTLGEHKAYATLLGKTVEFTVNVIETPFASVVFDDVEVMENIDGYEGEDYFIYRYTPSFTVNFKEAGKEPLVSQNGYVVYNGNRYYAELEEQNEAWAVGEHQASASVLGVSSTINVTVNECEYESLTISGENELILTFGEEAMPVSRIEIIDKWYDENCVLATIHTENRVFDAYIYFDANVDYANAYSKDLYIKIGTFTSNTLSKCNWLKANVFADDYVDYLDSYRSEGKNLDSMISTFGGTVTADNIDHLITLAVNYWCGDFGYEDVEWITVGDYQYAIMGIDTVKDNIKTLYGIENIDITLSKHYDATDPNNIKVLMMDGFIGSQEGDFTVVYANGEWIATYTPDYDANYEQLIFVMDENAAIKSFEFEGLPYIPGDLDEDGEITDADSILLARYLAGWNVEISLEAAAKVDGDEEISDADSILLDRYLAGWSVQIG